MSVEQALDEVRQLFHGGDLQGACSAAQDSLTTFPDHPQLWFFLGVARHALGELDAAIVALGHARRLAGELPAILNPLATVLVEQGRLDEALAAMDSALAAGPAEVTTLLNRGVVLDRLGRFEDAIQTYDHALRIDPAYQAARLNRGATLMMLERFHEAVDNNLVLVSQVPNSPDALFNLAEAYLGLGKGAEALAACERALHLDPRHARAHIDRGLAFADLGRFDEAQRAFDDAELLEPGCIRRYLDRIAPADPALPRVIDAHLFFFYRSYERLLRCDWSTRGRYIDELGRFISSSDASSGRIDLPLAYQSLTVPLPQGAPAKVAHAIGHRYATAVAQSGIRFEHASRPGRIRLGYLSADYREHLNAYLSHPLFRMHDRSRFEVHASSIGPDDGARIRQRIRDSADSFVDLRNLSDMEAAARIHADGIDLLVDFTGYTEHCRPAIPAQRPAPVQVAHIGFPGTSGAPWIDYRITDGIVTPPEQERHWSENLLLMPDSFFLYDGEQERPAESVRRSDYGLADDAFVFCAHHNGYKLDPVIFETWMGLLKEIPKAVLWISARHPAIGPNLRQQAVARGVDPARLVITPLELRSRYLARFVLADLFLDTIHFTAATTACDALWMGLPLLSIRGSTFTSRQSASILAALGMADMAVDSLEAYRERALHLACSPREMDELRERVRRGSLERNLFRPEAYVRHFERAAEVMVQRRREGLAPCRLRMTSAGEVRLD